MVTLVVILVLMLMMVHHGLGQLIIHILYLRHLVIVGDHSMLDKILQELAMDLQFMQLAQVLLDMQVGVVW